MNYPDWDRERDEAQLIAVALGSEFREYRLKQGLTQWELAARVGMRQNAITRLEAGHVLPSITTLRRVAAGLNLKVTITIGEDDGSH